MNRQEIIRIESLLQEWYCKNCDNIKDQDDKEDYLKILEALREYKIKLN